MGKIFAAVVTYNRLELLKRTISGIESQHRKPDHLIVIDNNSTDGTAEYLASRASDWLIVLRLPRNLGGAGGFKAAIKTAYEKGADWIWIMDDDCIPKPEALQRLESRISSPEIANPGFLASLVMFNETEPCEMNYPDPTWDWLRYHAVNPNIYPILSASFVSILLSREAVRKVGYPVEEFFIWYDDVEYTRRVTQHFQAYCIADSQVLHALPKNRGVNFTDITPANIWKFKYGVRNEAAVLTFAGRLGWLKAVNFIARRIREMRRGGIPFALQRAILWAGIQGMFFDYRKRIQYPGK